MVVAITMVRDEADIIGHSARHMLDQVDRVIALDNGSTDGTREILEGLGVEVIDDPERGYYQSEKMTALANMARQDGASFVVPFDADEIWVARGGRIRDVLGRLPADILIAEAALYDHVPTGADPDGPAVDRMRWRRPTAAPLPKVACRAVDGLTIHQGNHGATIANVDVPIRLAGALTVHHYPYRSAEQFVRKAHNGAAAYAATDLPFGVGQHWREYGALLEAHGPAALHDVFRTHFWSADPETAGLVYDPV